MLEQLVRPHYQRLFVDRIAAWIPDTITPSKITILGGLLGLAVIPALFYQHAYLAIVLLLSSGYLDTLDGTVARIKNQITTMGSALDIVMDRVVEFAVILGLWLVNPDERSFLCILMLGSILICVTSFLVAGIFIQNLSIKSFHYSPGLIERAEAFIFFMMMMLLPNYFFWLGILFVFLVLVTTVLRMREITLAN